MATVPVNWGDGSAVQNVTVVGDAASWSFIGVQHTYAAAGTFTITVGGLSGGSDTVDAHPVAVERVTIVAVTKDAHKVLLDGAGVRE